MRGSDEREKFERREELWGKRDESRMIFQWIVGNARLWKNLRQRLVFFPLKSCFIQKRKKRIFAIQQHAKSKGEKETGREKMEVMYTSSIALLSSLPLSLLSLRPLEKNQKNHSISQRTQRHGDEKKRGWENRVKRENDRIRETMCLCLNSFVFSRSLT